MNLENFFFVYLSLFSKIQSCDFLILFCTKMSDFLKYRFLDFNIFRDFSLINRFNIDVQGVGKCILKGIYIDFFE